MSAATALTIIGAWILLSVFTGFVVTRLFAINRREGEEHENRP